MTRRPHWNVSLDDYRLGGNPNDIDFYDEFDLCDLSDRNAKRIDELTLLAARAKSANLFRAFGIRYGDPLLVLQFPAGESTRHLFVDANSVEEVLACPFEKYEYLQNYDGIWSCRQNRVEALIRYSGGGGILAHYRSDPPRALAVRADNGIALRIGFPSADAIALLHTHIEDSFRELTVSIDGLPLAAHDEAEEAVETVGNAFLLQVEPIIGDLPHLIPRHRRPWKLPSNSQIRLRGADESTLVYPDPPVRSEPAKMYFYAHRIPGDLPVVRFLAFYQVIEYFFPIYARIRIVEQLQGILQSPSFNPRSAQDVGKLIAAVPRGGPQGLGAELGQLVTTLRRCVNIDALRSFLTEHRNHPITVQLTSNEQLLGSQPLRIEHSCDRQSLPNMSSPNSGCDCDEVLVKSLAQRIYNLRNRIVHSKEGVRDNAEGSVLPFMPQADYLDADIELLRHLARGVLTAPESGNPR